MTSRNDKQRVVEYVSTGGELALSLSIPILTGYWLDSRFETSPWLLVAGIFVGVALFGGAIWRLARKLPSH